MDKPICIDVLTRIEEHLVPTENVSIANVMIQRAFDGALGNGERRSVLIIGNSGCGKTTVLEEFYHRHPEERHEEGLSVPVVMTTVPAKPTVKGLAAALLQAIGEPDAGLKGTEQSLTYQLIRLIKAVKARIIMLDEFQHFISQHSERVQADVANWLKVLVETTGVNLVVSGTPKSRMVMEVAQGQLKRRFMAPVEMTEFDWKYPESRKEFIRMLGELGELCQPCVFPDLADESMAYRFYVATGGIPGRLVNLLRDVVSDAFAYKRFEIGLPELADAACNANYDEVFEVNPFTENFDLTAA